MVEQKELTKDETLAHLLGKEITLIDQLAGQTTYGRLVAGSKNWDCKEDVFEVYGRRHPDNGQTNHLRAMFPRSAFDRAELFYYDIHVYVNGYYV